MVCARKSYNPSSTSYQLMDYKCKGDTVDTNIVIRIELEKISPSSETPSKWHEQIENI